MYMYVYCLEYIRYILCYAMFACIVTFYRIIKLLDIRHIIVYMLLILSFIK